ncbi:ankyrin-2-like isoform X9 [Aphidius gifuensis]|uniref:ankyrin-2-like isoform X9 n=1 Tax=Aphidius gifuensis TaxID=684658 RepID=UPI001CDD23F6|nr:ankyrin-2-like isoform X9 [Aphidius gifuensis]
MAKDKAVKIRKKKQNKSNCCGCTKNRNSDIFCEDPMLSDQQQYRYMTVDDMKSMGDDSMRVNVTDDERDNRHSGGTNITDMITKENYHRTNAANLKPDNIDINRHPVHVGSIPEWKNFLVSFLVDARGGAMRGCRHSGVRVIVPPRKAAMPMRITCRYLKRDKLTNPPPLMEGEALASRILELGPVGAKFLGPVIIEVPHFASLRGKEREIVILRSDNGETWREHTLEASEEAVQDVLNESFEGEELSQLEDLQTSRIVRILTVDFPHYFAVVSRIRQEVHAVGPEGGTVSSSAVPQVQAVFPPAALTKKIRVGLQAHPISAELVAKLLGNRVAVSPIVTVEPRRRKFHKPITLTIPVPQAANKGMINQYSGDAPTLRLLCSITGGQSRAVWEDVTGSTPLTFVKDCVSFTTTVSARFWLMDCRNITEATRMATELYTHATHVPFMAKFVVFAKRVDPLEARLRVFCMTDDKEDKTLEHQEHFTEVAKSRDVEVLEGKIQYMEFAGNLVPVMKSGEQLQLPFRAFKENRIPFTTRVKDPDSVDMVGRIMFMNEPKVQKGEPSQIPICTLNILLPDKISPDGKHSEIDLLELSKNYSFLRDGGISRPDTIHRATIRLTDIANLLDTDWQKLAEELNISPNDVDLIKNEHPGKPAIQAASMFKIWQANGNKATGNTLEKALNKIGREDIVKKCIFNVELVTDDVEKAVARVRLDQPGFDALKEELGPSRDSSLRRDGTLGSRKIDFNFDESDRIKDSESIEDINIMGNMPNKQSKQQHITITNGTVFNGTSTPIKDKYASEEKELVDEMADFIEHKCHVNDTMTQKILEDDNDDDDDDKNEKKLQRVIEDANKIVTGVIQDAEKEKEKLAKEGLSGVGDKEAKGALGNIDKYIVEKNIIFGEGSVEPIIIKKQKIDNKPSDNSAKKISSVETITSTTTITTTSHQNIDEKPMSVDDEVTTPGKINYFGKNDPVIGPVIIVTQTDMTTTTTTIPIVEKIEGIVTTSVKEKLSKEDKEISERIKEDDMNTSIYENVYNTKSDDPKSDDESSTGAGGKKKKEKSGMFSGIFKKKNKKGSKDTSFDSGDEEKVVIIPIDQSKVIPTYPDFDPTNYIAICPQKLPENEPNRDPIWATADFLYDSRRSAEAFIPDSIERDIDEIEFATPPMPEEKIIIEDKIPEENTKQIDGETKEKHGFFSNLFTKGSKKPDGHIESIDSQHINGAPKDVVDGAIDSGKKITLEFETEGRKIKSDVDDKNKEIEKSVKAINSEIENVDIKIDEDKQQSGGIFGIFKSPKSKDRKRSKSKEKDTTKDIPVDSGDEELRIATAAFLDDTRKTAERALSEETREIIKPDDNTTEKYVTTTTVTEEFDIPTDKVKGFSYEVSKSPSNKIEKTITITTTTSTTIVDDKKNNEKTSAPDKNKNRLSGEFSDSADEGKNKGNGFFGMFKSPKLRSKKSRSRDRSSSKERSFDSGDEESRVELSGRKSLRDSPAKIEEETKQTVASESLVKERDEKDKGGLFGIFKSPKSSPKKRSKSKEKSMSTEPSTESADEEFKITATSKFLDDSRKFSDLQEEYPYPSAPIVTTESGTVSPDDTDAVDGVVTGGFLSGIYKTAKNVAEEVSEEVKEFLDETKEDAEIEKEKLAKEAEKQKNEAKNIKAKVDQEIKKEIEKTGEIVVEKTEDTKHALEKSKEKGSGFLSGIIKSAKHAVDEVSDEVKEFIEETEEKERAEEASIQQIKSEPEIKSKVTDKNKKSTKGPAPQKNGKDVADKKTVIKSVKEEVKVTKGKAPDGAKAVDTVKAKAKPPTKEASPKLDKPVAKVANGAKAPVDSGKIKPKSTKEASPKPTTKEASPKPVAAKAANGAKAAVDTSKTKLKPTKESSPKPIKEMAPKPPKETPTKPVKEMAPKPPKSNKESSPKLNKDAPVKSDKIDKSQTKTTTTIKQKESPKEPSKKGKSTLISGIIKGAKNAADEVADDIKDFVDETKKEAEKDEEEAKIAADKASKALKEIENNTIIITKDIDDQVNKSKDKVHEEMIQSKDQMVHTIIITGEKISDVASATTDAAKAATKKIASEVDKSASDVETDLSEAADELKEKHSGGLFGIFKSPKSKDKKRSKSKEKDSSKDISFDSGDEEVRNATAIFLEDTRRVAEPYTGLPDADKKLRNAAVDAAESAKVKAEKDAKNGADKHKGSFLSGLFKSAKNEADVSVNNAETFIEKTKQEVEKERDEAERAIIDAGKKIENTQEKAIEDLKKIKDQASFEACQISKDVNELVEETKDKANEKIITSKNVVVEDVGKIKDKVQKSISEEEKIIKDKVSGAVDATDDSIEKTKNKIKKDVKKNADKGKGFLSGIFKGAKHTAEEVNEEVKEFVDDTNKKTEKNQEKIQTVADDSVKLVKDESSKIAQQIDDAVDHATAATGDSIKKIKEDIGKLEVEKEKETSKIVESTEKTIDKVATETKKHGEKGKSFFSGIFKGIKHGADEIIDDIKEFSDETKKEAEEEEKKLKHTVDDSAKALKDLTDKNVENIKDLKSQVVEEIKKESNDVAGAVEKIKETTNEKLKAEKDAVVSAATTTRDKIFDAADKTTDTVEKTVSDVSDNIAKTKDSVKKGITEESKILKEKIEESVDQATDAAKKAQDKVKIEQEKAQQAADEIAKSIKDKAIEKVDVVKENLSDTASQISKNITVEVDKSKDAAKATTKKIVSEVDKTASDIETELSEAADELKEKHSGGLFGIFKSPKSKDRKRSKSKEKDSSKDISFDSGDEEVRNATAMFLENTRSVAEPYTPGLFNTEVKIDDSVESSKTKPDKTVKKESEKNKSQKSFFSGIFKGVKNAADEVTEEIKEFVDETKKEAEEDEEALKRAADDAAKNAESFTNKTIEDIKSTKAQVSDKTQEIIESGKKTIVEGVTTTGEKISEVKNSTSDSLTKSVKKIDDKINETKTEISKDIFEEIDIGKEKLNSAVDSAESAKNKVEKETKKSAEKSKGFFSGIFKGVKHGADEIIDDIKEFSDETKKEAEEEEKKINNAAKKIEEKTTEKLQAGKNAVVGTVSDVSDNIAKTSDKIKKDIDEESNVLKEKISEAVDSVADAAEKTKTKIDTKGEEAKHAAEEAAKSVKDIKDKTMEKIDTTKENISDGKIKVEKDAKKAAEKSKSFFSGIFKSAKHAADEVADDIKEFVEETEKEAEQDEEALKLAADEAAKKIKDSANKDIESASNVISSINTDTSKAVKDSVTKMSDDVTKAKDVITKEISDDKKIVKDAVTDAIDSTGKTKLKAETDGKKEIEKGKKSFFSGILKGAKHAADEVVEEFKEFVDETKEEAEKQEKALKETADDVSNAAKNLKDETTENLNTVKTQVSEKLSQASKDAGDVVTKTKDNTQKVITTGSETIVQGVHATGDKVSDVGTKLTDVSMKISDDVSKTKDTIAKEISDDKKIVKEKILEAVDTAAESAEKTKVKAEKEAEKGKGFFASIFKGVKHETETAVDNIETFIDKTKEEADNEKKEAQRAADEAAKAINDVKDKTVEKVGTIKENISETASQISKNLTDEVDKSKEKVVEFTAETVEKAKIKGEKETEKATGFLSGIFKKGKNATDEVVVDIKDFVDETKKESIEEEKNAHREFEETIKEKIIIDEEKPMETKEAKKLKQKSPEKESPKLFGILKSPKHKSSRVAKDSNEHIDRVQFGEVSEIKDATVAFLEDSRLTASNIEDSMPQDLNISDQDLSSSSSSSAAIDKEKKLQKKEKSKSVLSNIVQATEKFWDNKIHDLTGSHSSGSYDITNPDNDDPELREIKATYEPESDVLLESFNPIDSPSIDKTITTSSNTVNLLSSRIPLKTCTITKKIELTEDKFSVVVDDEVMNLVDSRVLGHLEPQSRQTVTTKVTKSSVRTTMATPPPSPDNLIDNSIKDVTEEAAKRAQVLADQAFVDGNKTESDFLQHSEPSYVETTTTEIDPETNERITKTVKTVTSSSSSVTGGTTGGSDELRESMQKIMDQFMTEERRGQ